MIDSFPQKVTTNFSHTISIEQFGLYAISITARCQEKFVTESVPGAIYLTTIGPFLFYQDPNEIKK